MIDWFVLLAPLAALPLVLIFGFLGCVLDRTGHTGEGITFRFPPGLATPLVKLRVRMTLSVNGWSQQEEHTLVATSGDFPPTMKGMIPFPTLAAKDDVYNTGEIGAAIDMLCECWITIVNQDTEVSVPVNPHPNLDNDGWSGEWNDYLLVVTGTGFDQGDYSVQ